MSERIRCRRALAATVVAGLLTLNLATARAQSEVSAVSALSALPIAVSVVAPVMILSAGASLAVVSVGASAEGAVWVLARASDGARATLVLSGQAAGALSVAAGTVVVVTAVGTGWVLSTASRAIAFIPNELGTALLYNERVTP